MAIIGRGDRRGRDYNRGNGRGAVGGVERLTDLIGDRISPGRSAGRNAEIAGGGVERHAGIACRSRDGDGDIARGRGQTIERVVTEHVGDIGRAVCPVDRACTVVARGDSSGIDDYCHHGVGAVGGVVVLADAVIDRVGSGGRSRRHIDQAGGRIEHRHRAAIDRRRRRSHRRCDRADHHRCAVQGIIDEGIDDVIAAIGAVDRCRSIAVRSDRGRVHHHADGRGGAIGGIGSLADLVSDCVSPRRDSWCDRHIAGRWIERDARIAGRSRDRDGHVPRGRSQPVERVVGQHVDNVGRAIGPVDWPGTVVARGNHREQGVVVDRLVVPGGRFKRPGRNGNPCRIGRDLRQHSDRTRHDQDESGRREEPAQGSPPLGGLPESRSAVHDQLAWHE